MGTVVSDLPGTPVPSCPEKSPVYAVPWKPKPTPRKRPPVPAQTVMSPPPPPIPPKLFASGNENSTEQPPARNHQTVEVCTAPEESSAGSNGVPCLPGSKDPSSMEVDECADDGQVFLQGEGWQGPVSAMPFSPPVKIRKTFFPQEQIYAEIDSLEMKPTDRNNSDSHEVSSSQIKTSTSSDVFIESVPETQNCNVNVNRNSASTVFSPESDVKHVVLDNLQKTKETRFSFSKYLITPEKRAAVPGKHPSSSLSENGKENVSSKKCLGQHHESMLPEAGTSQPEAGSSQKEKPAVMPRNIPKLRSEFRVTMTVSNGLHNVRNFVVGNNQVTEAKDKSWRKEESGKPQRKKEHHPRTCESKLEMTEKFSMSLDKLGNSQERLLETDIDSIPLPVMGSKTPPRKRKPLSNLQRSKSMETIIW